MKINPYKIYFYPVALSKTKRLAILSKISGKKHTQIFKSKNGKPFLKNSDLEFSISHTGEVEALSVSRQKIGIDIESVDRKVDFEKLAKRFFHPAETLKIKSLTASKKSKSFLKFWTLKEAFFKCTGSGIKLNLVRSLDFSKIKSGSTHLVGKKYFTFYVSIKKKYVISVVIHEK